MSIEVYLRRLARKGRALVRPLGQMPAHLGKHARRTAQELGFAPEVADWLAAAAQQTSQESGLTGSTSIEPGES